MSDEESSASSLHSAKKLPNFIKKLESQNVCEGSHFEFVCHIQQQPNLQVTWIKDNKTNLPDKYIISSDGNVHKLTCKISSLSDAGRFVCIAKHEFGEKRSMAGLVISKKAHQSQVSEMSKRHARVKTFEISKGKFENKSENKPMSLKSSDLNKGRSSETVVSKSGNLCQEMEKSLNGATKEIEVDVSGISSNCDIFLAPQLDIEANKISTFSTISFPSSKVVNLNEDDENSKHREEITEDQTPLKREPQSAGVLTSKTSFFFKKTKNTENFNLNSLKNTAKCVINKKIVRASTGGTNFDDLCAQNRETLFGEVRVGNVSYETECHKNKSDVVGPKTIVVEDRLEMTSGKMPSESVENSLATNRGKHGNEKKDLRVSIESGWNKKDILTVPEVLHLQPEDLHVVRGSDVSLVALFTSPVDDLCVKWFKGPNEISPDERIRMMTSGSTSELKIIESHPGDSECYAVRIENDIGSDQMSSSVTVEDVPEPPFDRPAVTSVTATSLVLSWYGPVFDGASPVLGYKIEQLQLFKDGNKKKKESESESGWEVVCEDCQHTTYQVMNLFEDDTRSQFRISCRNKHGFSRPGVLSETVALKSCIEGTLTFPPKIISMDPTRNFYNYYVLGDVVGRGKFGVVQECFDKSTNHLYAAKVIKLKPGQRVEFKQEVDIMNQLHHPKLLQLWDAFESKREAVLVMEFIGGRELLERITTDNYTLTEGDCAHYIRQICQAVDYMHEKNILHLDLKLENVLCLTEVGKDIKIIDFGLSRVCKPNESLKVMFGTPEFVAPEVVNYDPVSPPTDMWSVGVMSYILLSGFSPFSGDNDSETLCNITKANYDFDEGFDEVSDKAKNFIASLLVKDPKKRMTSSECLTHDWLCGDEADMVVVKLSTVQHKKFLARRKWQKSGNAIRALSRLTGDSKLFARPRGMSVDRKTFLNKLLSRNSSRDSGLSDSVFDPCPSSLIAFTTPRGQPTSVGSNLGRRKWKSCGSLDVETKKSMKHAPVSKVLSCTESSR